MQKVTIYGDPNDVHAFDAEIDSARWNGWVCPRFSLEVVREIAAWTDRMIERDGTDGWSRVRVTDDDRVEIVDFEGTDEEEIEEVAPYDDGLYGVGAYGWTWELVETESEREARHAVERQAYADKLAALDGRLRRLPGILQATKLEGYPSRVVVNLDALEQYLEGRRALPGADQSLHVLDLGTVGYVRCTCQKEFSTIEAFQDHVRDAS